MWCWYLFTNPHWPGSAAWFPSGPTGDDMIRAELEGSETATAAGITVRAGFGVGFRRLGAMDTAPPHAPKRGGGPPRTRLSPPSRVEEVS